MVEINAQTEKYKVEVPGWGELAGGSAEGKSGKGVGTETRWLEWRWDDLFRSVQRP